MPRSPSPFLRPAPVLRLAGRPVDRATPRDRAVRALLAGETLRVTDHVRTAGALIGALGAALPPPPADADHATARAARRAWLAANARLLVPVVDHRLALGGAGEPGFLPELYPELPRLLLPALEVQDLEAAWRRYQEGVHLPVLGYRLHPFYGTYLPTRMAHLELFGTWLSQYAGARGRAVDVGTGSGVLALMLRKAGFGWVRATDTNPNAVESLRRDLARRPAPGRVEPWHGDLLGEDPALVEHPVDLVVFNPPWTPGPVEGPVDRALFYEEGLFARFFDQALARLAPGGRVVLVFSNLLELVRPDLPHPIRQELDRGRFVPVAQLQRRIKPDRAAPGPRRRTRERVEIWELARA